MNCRVWMLAVLSAAAVVFGTVANAEACTCIDTPLCQRLWEPDTGAPAFFAATVAAIEPADDATYVVRLRDVQAVHGLTATEVVTSRSGDSCGYEFTVGERYFIDAWAREGGGLATSSCSKTTPLVQAKAHIDYLESLSRPAPGGRVFGTAFTDLPVFTMFDDNDRQPLAHLRVTLSGPVTRRAATGADGVFSFAGLPPGQYRLHADAPPSMRQVTPPPATISLPNARACVEQRLLYERPRR